MGKSRLDAERKAGQKSERTNKKDQSIGGSLGVSWALHLEQSHAGHDGTDEVNVEDGSYVYQVKDHGQGQESKSWETRHCGVLVVQFATTRRRSPRTLQLGSCNSTRRKE